MTTRTPYQRACPVAGCPRPAGPRGRCAVHERVADELRGLASDRLHADLYQSPQWRRLRASVLAAHPWCECPGCRAVGPRWRATTVHHIRPHGGDPALFFDRRNLLAVTSMCHNVLTNAERAGGAGPMARRSIGDKP